MDSHIGMRQSTRVAIKKSLADMAGKEDDLEKVAKPVGKADMVKNKRRATEKKFFGNRKRRNVKRAGKKRALVRAKAADMPEVEFLSLGSDDLLMTEEVSREDCTTMVATDFEEPLEQPAEVSMRAILDGLLETLGEDLAQFKVEMEEEKDGDSQTFEEIQEVPSPTEDTADERDDSIEAQLLHLVTPFPQKLNPLIDYPPAEPPAKLSPVRGEKKLKICSWLIEGMLSESVIDYIRNNDWDILCLQGLRWSDKNQVPSEFERILQPYHCYWRFEEQGFCLLVMSRIKAENEIFNENFEKHLVQTLGFDGFVLANALAPSAGTGLVDLDDKLKWFDTLSGHLDVMNETPVIIAGSLGVAHRAIGKIFPNKARTFINSYFCRHRRPKDYRRFHQRRTGSYDCSAGKRLHRLVPLSERRPESLQLFHNASCVWPLGGHRHTLPLLYCF